MRIFDANPALDANAREIGGLNLTLGFDDKRSAAVPLGSVVKTISGDVTTGKPETMEGAVYLAMPVKSAADAKHVALQCAMSDAFKPSGSIAAITCAKKDGGAPVEIDGTAVRTLKTGWTGAAGTNVYQCQWSNISYNIDEYINASNKLRAMTDAEMEEQGVIRPGSYVDPGEVTGAYGWKDKGHEYVIAKFNMTALSRMTSMSDSSTLLFDNVAVGNANAAFGGYMIMSGTSMATPAVAGCVAVVAKDEPESKDLDEAALEQLARDRAAKLLAAVDYDADLSKLCRTGGRVNLHGKVGNEFTKKAALITGANVEDNVLTIKGCYFGSGGTLSIDDNEIATTAWADGEITATLPSLFNGPHVAKVKNADGAFTRVVFSYSSAQASGRPLYENELVPLEKDATVAEAVAKKDTDSFFGPMAACDGSVFAITVKAQPENLADTVWRYDTSANTWKDLGMPVESDSEEKKWA